MTTDAVPLTHEFLAVMLGVRRAGVTVAIHDLERRGLITRRRGQLTMCDRAGMEKIAGSFYGAPEAELNRLLGNADASETVATWVLDQPRVRHNEPAASATGD